MKRYMVKEIFYSIQGEGVRAGIPHVFVRFAGCNLDCNDETMGWRCDTDFVGGTAYTLGELVDEIRHIGRLCRWVLFTGGEPGLQVDADLVNALKALGYRLAIETNGTKELPKGLDWVCCSPKYQRPKTYAKYDEVKYVLAVGQAPPERLTYGEHMLVSPAFKGDEPDPDAVAWCVDYVLTHPEWHLSLQTHKWIGVR